MSYTSEDGDGGPLINSDTSKGSSVSSGLQEEYNELLKYAIVTPKWNPEAQHTNMSLPQLQLTEPDNLPLTTVDEFSGVSSSSRSNDGTDSAMGSDELTSDRKTFREPPHLPDFQPLEIQASSYHKTPVQIHDVSHIDPDFKRIDQQLKNWNIKLNKMVLAEMSQTKTDITEQYRKMLHSKEKEHEASMNKLQNEVEDLKELLHTCETSLARKDSVILNLTRTLQTNKEKQEMMRALSMWKLRLSDEKRMAFTSNIARRHRERVVAIRAWQSWRAVVEGKWRDKVERACQKKAQEVCMTLTDDYEAKIASLNDALQASRDEVLRLNGEREKYEETMKKAFMRGVCALNLEAMSMFEGEGKDPGQIQTLAAAVDALSCEPEETSRNIPSIDVKRVHMNRVDVIPTRDNGVRNHVIPQTNVVQTLETPSYAQIPPVTQKATKRTSSKNSNMRVFPTGGAERPRSSQRMKVVVKRHHPNVQNVVTQQTLKHVAKYPNTQNKPIL
ncbi:unnamed protein product [Clavelina lepadiformis]|uniref:Centrosomal protein POC5 n=1 Tax=Clavelina lepadiformis TaxID=159417 RepID=A0ABP0F0L9_CLALP